MSELETKTVEVAQSYQSLSEDDLLRLLARQDAAIQTNPDDALDPSLNPQYEDPGMSLAAIKAIGRRIMNEWNQRLYKLICEGSDDADRKKLTDAFGLGETALIGAVASVLLTIASPAIAAAAAAIIVKHFLLPAGGIACDVWEEAIALET